MRRLPCFANSQAAGLSWARKSDEVGLGVLAAYSVGYIIEVVMAALRYMGFPHTPMHQYPKNAKAHRGGLFNPHECGEMLQYRMTPFQHFLSRTSAARFHTTLREPGAQVFGKKKKKGDLSAPPFQLHIINGFVNLDIDKSIGVDVSQYRTALRTVQVQDLFYINRRV